MRIKLVIALAVFLVATHGRPALAQDKLNFAYISPNDAASMVYPSLIKSIDDEGYLKKLK